MKKICFFMDSPFSLGGEQRVVSCLANELINQCYDVSFVLTTNQKHQDYSLYNLNENVKVYYIDKYNSFVHRLVRKAFTLLRSYGTKSKIIAKSKKIQRKSFLNNLDKKVIEKEFNNLNFDYVIGVAGVHTAILSCLENTNYKKIGWQHSTYEAYFAMKGRRFNNYRLFVLDMFKNLDYYIVQTNDDKEKIKNEFGFDPIVINNPNTFSSNEKSLLNKKNFLSVGRFTFVKGYEYLIDAFYKFSLVNKEWNLLIVGDGDLYNVYKQKINAYKLNDRIILTGKTNNVEKYYLDSSIYCSTSLWEGWGMSVTEAMSYGIPIISFDIPSIHEIFKDANCGEIVKYLDVEELANKMLEMVKNEEKLKEIGNNCFHQVKMFDIKYIIRNWIQIIEGEDNA